MRWASAGSTESNIAAAIAEAAAVLRTEMGSAEPDLILAFVSAHHRPRLGGVPDLIRQEFRSGVLLGCSAGGVIGGGREIEERPGISLTIATLPGVDVAPFHLTEASTTQLPRRVATPDTHFLLLGEPFSFDAEPFLKQLDRAHPASRKLGGLASGGRRPGENALFLGERVLDSGMIGVALSGDIVVETIVAQGCRPIGQPMFATKCQRNVIWELDGRPALEVLQAIYEQLEPADQELARHSLFIGLVMDEDRSEYRQGDFLIRNLIGMDAESGVLAVAAAIHQEAVVQFHLRDAGTSAADLEQMLAAYTAARSEVSRPAGALLFSCLGRGKFLYGRADHDTGAFEKHLGAVPLGGFFCNGEIGPVQGSTFLHGYTSAFGLFRPRTK